METINVINVGGVDKEIEDTVARASGADADSRLDTLEPKVTQEIANRTAADTTINARIDQIVAPTGQAPNPAEITDARIGADGITYETLGKAIRAQINECIVAGINGQNNVTASNYSTLLPDANVRVNKAFKLNFSNGATSIPAHLPFTSFPSSTPVFLICTDTYQILFDRSTFYTRFYVGAWSNWVTKNYAEYLSAGINGQNNVTASNYSTLLPDANVMINKTYKLNFSNGATSIPAHLPFTSFPSSTPVFLICTDTYQILFDRSTFYTRFYVGAWSNWSSSNSGNNALTFKGHVNASNYETVLPDLDLAESLSIYGLNFATRSTDIPTNMPYKVNETSLAYLITIGKSNEVYGQQIFIDSNGGAFIRIKAITWGDWVSLLNNNKSFVEVKSGDNLVKAIIENEGREIHVQPGTYDIIADYEELYGADYFTNYTGYSDGEGYGTPVRNGTKLVFSPFARVTCNYTGNNPAVTQYFSAFNVGTCASINGLNLYTRHLRYAIHDDLITSAIWGVNEYHNCVIDSDTRCIGGGMKPNMSYIIKNCVFKSQFQYDVSYHNSGSEGQQNFKCSECYFEHTIEFGYYGNSETKTKCFITNNSLGSAIIKEATTPDSLDNIDILEWNNVIRA